MTELTEDVQRTPPRSFLKDLVLAALIAAAPTALALNTIFEDSAPSSACPAYWTAITKAADQGLNRTLRLYDDTNLETACGEAHEVAEDYLEDRSNP